MSIPTYEAIAADALAARIANAANDLRQAANALDRHAADVRARAVSSDASPAGRPYAHLAERAIQTIVTAVSAPSLAGLAGAAAEVEAAAAAAPKKQG